jgi:hypothetical protein
MTAVTATAVCVGGGHRRTPPALSCSTMSETPTGVLQHATLLVTLLFLVDSSAGDPYLASSDANLTQAQPFTLNQPALPGSYPPSPTPAAPLLPSSQQSVAPLQRGPR